MADTKPLPTPRVELLHHALQLISRERPAQYGSGIANFEDTAEMATVLLRPLLKEGARLTPHHIAEILVLLKFARAIYSPDIEDHWADAAGYIALAWECVVEEGKKSDGTP